MKLKNNNAAVCFWSWNGEICKEEIERQLTEFADGRMGGVIIHARAGLKIKYLGKLWFELFEYAVKTAMRLGLEIWIYDEDGWPSGFGGGEVPELNPKYYHKSLRFSYGSNELPDDISSDQIIAVYQKEITGNYQRKSELKIQSLEFKDDATLQDDDIIIWYTYEKHYVDLLNPDVVKAFIKSTHEKYAENLGKYFGTVIKGFFTDEPQMNYSGYPWSFCMESAFKEETGKDLLDLLWLAVENGEGYLDFRRKLWHSIIIKYYKSFVMQISNWCSLHNIMLTGHFPAEDGLCSQLAGCGDVMLNYSGMQLPGIDHLGCRVASPVLMKQASSIANQYGNGTVLSETFGCAGWGVNFSELAWIWGGQSVLGITKPCYHLSAYTIEGRRKRDYPAFYSYQEPWWNEFKYFAKWMNEINLLMTEGTRDVHTLIVSPNDSIMAEYQDDWHDKTAIKNTSAQFRVLLENLLDLQLDVELSDSYLLCRDAKVNNGIIQLGSQQYDTVYIAQTFVIDRSLCHLLRKFSQSGGRLICINQRPIFYSDGSRFDQPDLFNNIYCNRRDTIEKYVENTFVERYCTVCDRFDAKPVKGLRLHTRSIKEGKRVHIWPETDFISQDVFVCAKGDVSIFKYDIMNSQRKRLNVNHNTDYTYAEIQIAGKENIILDITNNDNVKAEVIKKVSDKNIDNIEVLLSAPNSITIDYAQYSSDRVNFCEAESVLSVIDRIYKDRSNEKMNISLRYSFYIEDGLDTSGLEMYFENQHCSAVFINGTEIFAKSDKWWIDHCINAFSIEDYALTGKNIIELWYDIPQEIKHIETDTVYETEINRFYYPVEPDSIYICGNFDVKTLDDINYMGYCYKTGKRGFVIAEPSEKKIGDLTIQNMWFYRGNVKYRFTVKKPNDEKHISVCVNKYYGTALLIHINGETRYSHAHPASFDITSCLKDGTNEIIIELLGNNRNLLGPHHHVNGENRLIGPATFAGIWAPLEEFLSPSLYHKPTWTDQYGFVPFGIEDIQIVEFNIG